MSALGEKASTATWTDLAAAGDGVEARRILVVPVGSIEQHGPHLPLDTDCRIATALADGLAAARPDVFLAPVLAYGSSGEHAGFPGTLSVGATVFEAVLIELVRSADAFAGVVFVNGHGGNAMPLRRAVSVAEAEGRHVMAWSWSLPDGEPRADAHAGYVETSLVLAIAPEVVRLDEARPGDPRPLGEVIGELRTGGVAAVSPNGVLGDPRGATADVGRALLANLVDDLVEQVARVFSTQP